MMKKENKNFSDSPQDHVGGIILLIRNDEQTQENISLSSLYEVAFLCGSGGKVNGGAIIAQGALYPDGTCPLPAASYSVSIFHSLVSSRHALLPMGS